MYKLENKKYYKIQLKDKQKYSYGLFTVTKRKIYLLTTFLILRVYKTVYLNFLPA